MKDEFHFAIPTIEDFRLENPKKINKIDGRKDEAYAMKQCLLNRNANFKKHNQKAKAEPSATQPLKAKL